MTSESHPLRRPDVWGQKILATFPVDLREQALARWIQVANSGPMYPGIRHEGGLAPHSRANLELGVLKRELEQIRFSTDTTDADIVEAACKLASLCERRNFFGARIAEHYGIELKWPKTVTAEGVQRRFCDPRWWARRLRAQIGRAVEEAMRRRALVRVGKAVYLTDWSLRRWKGQRSANRRMMEESVLVNEEGTRLDLWEVAQASVSNPVHRRQEMMLRAKGFELQALANGYTWTFATLTAPSAFHPQLEAGGDNPQYQNFSVREAQEWLCKRWENARAQLDRDGISYFGLRVAEPHHDGTPHWHALLFVTPAQMDRVEDVLRVQWLSEYEDERGARDHRVKFEREDKKRTGSSAAGYIAKYIGKNVDGHGVDTDYTARMDGAEASVRATAWASVHGIRQFQQLGGPAVGLWRELRRLRDPVPHPEIEAARMHTSKPACWSKFMDAAGGIVAGRKTTLQLWKQRTPHLNRYGERRAPLIVGVQSALHCIRTRLHVWRIERRPRQSFPLSSGAAETAWRDTPAGFISPSVWSPLGPVSITVRAREDAPSSYIIDAYASHPPRGSPWTH